MNLPLHSDAKWAGIFFVQWIQTATFSQGQNQSNTVSAPLVLPLKLSMLHEHPKQSHHDLSYSSPPGVSWPLGNFHLNYTSCCYLLCKMALFPWAQCYWDMKAISYWSNQRVAPLNLKRKVIGIVCFVLFCFNFLFFTFQPWSWIWPKNK